MFAPPPIQLTREQIEKLKNERISRELEKKEKRKSAESGDGSEEKLSKVDSPTSLQRSESKAPKAARKGGLLARNSKLRVSKPILQSAPPQEVQTASPSTIEAPGLRAERRSSVARKAEQDHGSASPPPGLPPPVPFGGAPRKAPLPPKRPARPSSGLFSPSVPGAFPDESAAVEVPERSPPPPPVPEKSSRRGSTGIRQPQPGQPDRKRSVLDDKSLNEALAHLRIEDDRPAHPARSSTAPFTAGLLSNGSLKSVPVKSERETFIDGITKRLPAARDNKWLYGVQGSKIDKTPRKRVSAAAALEATLIELEYPGLRAASKPPRRATESEIKPARVSTPPKELQLPWKRRRKGETMSMLMNGGFFPVKEVTMHNKNNPNVNILIPVPPRLSLLDKDLPNTPDSIMATPTELYQIGPRKSLPAVPQHRRLGKPKRSPLAQVSSTNAKANSGTRSASISPGRLSAIPELSSLSENSLPPSGVATPVTTQIHLRGGSVVTVTPPELTAWQQHLYIQGPIKLPKPAIMPRKDSVASLEPFQEAIDQVYQTALVVPRRRSDDAVVDDICEWLDDFGFEDIKYEGDTLMIEDINLDEVQEVNEMDSQDQRFSTPPPEPEPTPLEKIMAKEVASARGSNPIPKPPIPPVETEETLRARGIARLSQNAAAMSAARKESLPLARSDSIVTPVLEESMLSTEHSSTEPEVDEQAAPVLTDQGGMDWDDVEEMDEQPTWVAPAISRKKQARHKGLSIKETRNPVLKMRRLMATASAIL